MTDAGKTNYGCFLYLHEQINYNGNSANLYGAQTLPNMKSVDGQDWSDHRPKALTTGDSTWVEIYTKENYQGSVARFGPNSTICNLYDFKSGDDDFGNATRSLKIFDARPAQWPGSSTETQPNYAMTDVRSASVNRKIRGGALSAIGKIPYLGTPLKVMTGVLWRPGVSKTELWEEMREWLGQVLTQVVAQLKAQMDLTEIVGLTNQLIDYASKNDESLFDHIYEEVRRLEPRFVRSAGMGGVPDAAENLTYLTLFGTIALTTYRSGYLYFDEIYGAKGPEADKERKQKHENLLQGMKNLREAVRTGFDAALAARLELIDRKEKVTGIHEGDYWALDQYTGLTSARYYYEIGNKTWCREAANSDVDRMRSQAKQTFDSEFDIFLEVADLWSYFDREFSEGMLSKYYKTSYMGDWGRYGNSEDDVSYGSMAVYSKTDRITQVALHGGTGKAQFVEGIGVTWILDGAARTQHWGETSKNPLVIDIAANETIVALFGASDAKLDRVSLRIQSFDKNGEPAGYPRELGVGAGDGGLPFSAAGPDGGDSRLAGLFFRVKGKNSGHLVGLGSSWGYERVQASTS